MSNLQASQEPRGGADVAAQALRQLHSTAGGKSGLRALNPDLLGLGVHHAVFDLNAGLLAERGRLDQAVRTGSRYLIFDASGPCAAIEIATDPQGSVAAEFKSLNRGPLVEGTQAAIRAEESQPGEESCTFSLLRIAALRLWLLWVKPNDASRAARFYLIEPAPGDLHGGPYTEDALLTTLRPLAQDLLRQPAAGGDELAD